VTAGKVTSPEGTERLHEYWVHGDGAAKIQWGEPGDFDRCVVELGRHIRDPQGYCNLAHHAALGIWPATHAAEIKKETGRSSVTVTQRAEMATASINDLPDSDFAYIEPGGTKDGSGKTMPRDKRHFPLQDADHVRDALSRAPQSPFGDKAMPKIKAAARKFGVDVSDDTSQPATRAEFMRMYPLEDMHILTRSEGDGSGRVVEAYATVFDQPAEIHDGQGHYMEVIDRSAFDAVLGRIQASRGGLPAAVKVLYNHGKTMEGVPAPEYQLPLGVPLEIRPERRGLLTRTEYDPTDPFTERILSKIKSGAITAQSFVGGIMRSTPELRGPGDRHRARNGALVTVRRMALGLREYGPVLFPAYSGAEILGVRMSIPGSLEPDTTEYEEVPPANEGDATGGPPEDGTSARHHQHQLFVLRSREQRERIGLKWLRDRKGEWHGHAEGEAGGDGQDQGRSPADGAGRDGHGGGLRRPAGHARGAVGAARRRVQAHHRADGQGPGHHPDRWRPGEPGGGRRHRRRPPHAGVHAAPRPVRRPGPGAHRHGAPRRPHLAGAVRDRERQPAPRAGR
jgi:phage head maturation protease